jgi:hypothetical protein
LLDHDAALVVGDGTGIVEPLRIEIALGDVPLPKRRAEGADRVSRLEVAGLKAQTGENAGERRDGLR